jgi:alcohol dehydrogenase (NADP+)
MHSQVPAVHQLEMHPWLQQSGFATFHQQRGIHLTQYSPFGNSNPVYNKGKEYHQLIEDPTLVEIGKKYGKSGAQVALAWGIAHGRSVIPKSKTKERIKANLEGDFQLEEQDVKKVDAMDRRIRLNDPSGTFGWNFYADLDGKSA